jgi:hypothetical protein
MREFHDEQITGLKHIYDSLKNDINLTLTLSRIGYPDLFIVKRGKSFILLYFDDRRLRNFYYSIYTLILLKNDGDVLFVNNDVTPIDQLEKANKTTTCKCKEHVIKDEEILLFLNNNWNKTIIFSFALLDYIIHGETPEQRRYKKNQKATWTGIIIAIGIGLIGIVFNVLALCKATKFDKIQLNQIEQSIQKQKIPEFKNANIIKDTFKVEKKLQPLTPAKPQ